jgi:hypothetical protein
LEKKARKLSTEIPNLFYALLSRKALSALSEQFPPKKGLLGKEET